MTKITRLAVAGRYAERQAIKRILKDAQLADLPAEITASWLTLTAEGDGDLTDDQAIEQSNENLCEIGRADILLYFPSWTTHTIPLEPAKEVPRWSPGRLIDYGMALACGLRIVIVGKPEPSIYFKGVQFCTPEELRETVQNVIEQLSTEMV